MWQKLDSFLTFNFVVHLFTSFVKLTKLILTTYCCMVDIELNAANLVIYDIIFSS